MRWIFLFLSFTLGACAKREFDQSPRCIRETNCTTTMIPMIVGENVFMMPMTTCECQEYADAGK